MGAIQLRECRAVGTEGPKWPSFRARADGRIDKRTGWPPAAGAYPWWNVASLEVVAVPLRCGGVAAHTDMMPTLLPYLSEEGVAAAKRWTVSEEHVSVISIRA